MALQDRFTEEAKERKRALEAYVYDMRHKLNCIYAEFVSPSEKEKFIASLKLVEDCLDLDGEDETKRVYITKLQELKEEGDIIAERYKEYKERGIAVDQFHYCLSIYRCKIRSDDPKYDCVCLQEKQKVLDACDEVETWLNHKTQQQDALPKYATPVLTTSDLRVKAEEFIRFCSKVGAVMMKPEPAAERIKEVGVGTLGRNTVVARIPTNGACDGVCLY